MNLLIKNCQDRFLQYHIRSKRFGIFVSCVALSACSLSPWSETKNADPKEVLTNIAENTLQNDFGFKKAEVELESKDEAFKPDFRIKTMSLLRESEDSKSYSLGQANLSKQGSDTTVNLGYVRRHLSSDEAMLFGYNVFYDHEFPRNHQRASLGLEIKSNSVEVNANIYRALSKDKTKDDVTERAMDGYDVELGVPVPYMPSSTLYFAGYKWDGESYDISSGKRLSIETKIGKAAKLEIGLDDNDRYPDTKATMKFSMSLGPALENVEPKPVFSSDMFSIAEKVSQRAKIYDFVRRQNRIVKTVSGSVKVARGT